MGLMATRRNLAILHEILQAIRVAFDEKILPDETIQRALDRSSRQAQRDWSTLVVAACETQGQSQNELLRAYLVRIRNNIASHYYQPRQLLMGYQRHFFEMSPSIRNESAFASLGVSMAASRFYFADAAAQAAQTLQDPEEALLLDADEHLNCVNAALRQLVENYLVLKERDLPPKVRRRARQGGQPVIAAIYARKSTDQSGVSDDQKSVARQIEHARAVRRPQGLDGRRRARLRR